MFLSFNKTIEEQIALIEADAKSLRERLGLQNIGEILPEASEVTEVLFKHFDATLNVHIFGKDYKHSNYWRYIRTCTPTNKTGSFVAHIGLWAGEVGIGDWERYERSVLIGAARWIVPTEIR